MASTRITGARTDFTAKDTGVRKVSKQIADQFRRQEKELSKLRKQAQRANKQFAAFKGTLKGFAGAATGFIAGGLGVNAFINASKEAATFATGLVEAADNAGLLATEMEAIREIMKQDGIRFKQTDTLLRRLNRRFADAQAGNKKLREAFAAAGIDVDNFKGSTSDLFAAIGSGVSKIETIGEKTKVAFAIFDTEGGRAIGTFDKYGDSLGEVIRKTDQATKTTNKQYEAAKNITGELQSLNRALQDITIQNVVKHKETILRAAEAWNTIKIKALEYFAAVADGFTTQGGDLDPGKLKEQYNLAFTQLNRYRTEFDNLMKGGQGGSQRATDLAVLINKQQIELERLANLMKQAQDLANKPIEAQIPKKSTTPIPDAYNLGTFQSYAKQANDEALAWGNLDKAIEEVNAESKRQAEMQQRVREINMRAARESQIAWKSAAASMARSASSSFASFITGASSAKDAFRSFAQTVIDQLIQIHVTSKLTGTLLGLFGGGGNPAFGAFAGAFTNSGYKITGGPRAQGGPLAPGKSYLVAEPGTGGEIIQMGKQGGFAMPVNKIGGDTINISFGSITVGNVPGQTETETQQQILQLLDSRIKESFRNLGRGSYERTMLRRAS